MLTDRAAVAWRATHISCDLLPLYSCSATNCHALPAASPDCPNLIPWLAPQAAAERVAAFKRTMDRCHARVQV